MHNTLLIKLFGNDYTIKFPNAGQIIDIENLKVAITKGSYSTMAASAVGIPTQELALDLVDAIACFSVLIPELKSLLEEKDISSILEMDLKQAKEIRTVYNKKFWPWYKEILDDLQSDIEIDSVEKLTSKSQDGD